MRDIIRRLRTIWRRFKPICHTHGPANPRGEPDAEYGLYENWDA